MRLRNVFEGLRGWVYRWKQGGKGGGGCLIGQFLRFAVLPCDVRVW